MNVDDTLEYIHYEQDPEAALAAAVDLLQRVTLVGYMGKNTRMVFSSTSRRHPEAYVAVYAFEDVPEDDDSKKETKRFLNS